MFAHLVFLVYVCVSLFMVVLMYVFGSMFDGVGIC